MPRHQQFVIWMGWVLGGLLALGTFVDAVSNVLLMTWQVSVKGSLLLLVVWVGIELVLRHRGIEWRGNSGVTVRLKRLGSQPRLALAGAVLLLWIPQLLHVRRVPAPIIVDQAPAGGTALKAPVLAVPVQTSHGAQSPNVSGTSGDVVIQYGARSREPKARQKRQ